MNLKERNKARKEEIRFERSETYTFCNNVRSCRELDLTLLPACH